MGEEVSVEANKEETKNASSRGNEKKKKEERFTGKQPRTFPINQNGV